MKMLKCLFAVVVLILSIAETQAQNVTKEVYKKTPTRDLTLKIYSPSGIKNNDKRPAIVFFFGGGWRSRNLEQFERHAKVLSDKGLQFFVHAGPQISFLISESETIKGIDMNTLSNTQKAVYGVKIQNKFDYGIAGGGGVELRTKKAGSFIVEGRYYFALSDFYSTTKKDYFARAAHGTITIKLTYLFDLKK